MGRWGAIPHGTAAGTTMGVNGGARSTSGTKAAGTKAAGELGGGEAHSCASRTTGTPPVLSCPFLPGVCGLR